jgi:hypothetical protein
MKLNEFIRSIKVWTNEQENSILEKIDGLVLVASFTEPDQFVIEGLVRKSLLIKVESKGVTYVYPNV